MVRLGNLAARAEQAGNRRGCSAADPLPAGRAGSRGGACRRRRFLRVAALAAAAWVLCPRAGAEADTASLKKIRTWCTPAYTRVVLDLDRPVTYQVGRLDADLAARVPERLYLDLFRTHCAGNLPRQIDLKVGPVQSIRAAAFREDTGRLVLDLRCIERYEVFSLEAPDRIVVDLWNDPEKNPAGEAPRSDPASARNPAGEAPRSDPASARADTGRLPLIVLDPGHGGSDPGAIGLTGLQEKDVVLPIARELKRILEERGRVRVILTRTRDTFLSLKERTRIANAREADLFVSIHANASPHRKVRGIETYYLDNTTDRASIRLARLENRSEGGEIDDLHSILRDLRLSSNANESHILAQTVQESLTGRLRKDYSGIQDLGAKGNLFFVLLGAHMPSVLVEVSFISNPVEEKRLRDPAYLRGIARGIADGIDAYCEQPSMYRMAAGPPGGGG